MSNVQVINRQVCPGFLSLLTLIFITLKLTGVIAWPWLAVLSPLLLGLAAVVLIFVIAFALAILAALLS